MGQRELPEAVARLWRNEAAASELRDLECLADYRLLVPAAQLAGTDVAGATVDAVVAHATARKDCHRRSSTFSPVNMAKLLSPTHSEFFFPDNYEGSCASDFEGSPDSG